MDEFTKVTGYHRKAIIRLLHRVNQPNANSKRGRPRQYSAATPLAIRRFDSEEVRAIRADTRLPGLMYGR